MTEPKTCPHCLEGEYIVKVTKFWHRITPGLVKTLVKVYKRVCEKNNNLVFVNELDLNHSEYGNFQKLRFHALIAKYRKSGQVIHRSWVITKRGSDFIKGTKIPDKVQTLLNHVIAHSDRLISLTDVMRSEIDWESYEDFKNQIQLPLVEFAEAEDNIDNIKTVISKKKKGKKYCKRCNAQMKMNNIFFERPDGIAVLLSSNWHCPVCGLEESI